MAKPLIPLDFSIQHKNMASAAKRRDFYHKSNILRPMRVAHRLPAAGAVNKPPFCTYFVDKIVSKRIDAYQSL